MRDRRQDMRHCSERNVSKVTGYARQEMGFESPKMGYERPKMRYERQETRYKRQEVEYETLEKRDGIQKTGDRGQETGDGRCTLCQCCGAGAGRSRSWCEDVKAKTFFTTF